VEELISKLAIAILLSFVYAAFKVMNHVVEHDVANNDSMATSLYIISWRLLAVDLLLNLDVFGCVWMGKMGRWVKYK